MKRIAIIGGGISGLSAAFTLEQNRRAGVPLKYCLYECASRLGGVLVTEREEDCIIEAGPDSFLSEKPWAIELCRQVGLGDQLIGSNDAGRKTYILLHGRLVALPDGLMFMVPTNLRAAVLSPLFSIRTKLRIAREWFHPLSRAGADESVAAFVERHYGSEMVERLADPLLSGVYGGEASELSVRAVLPRFAAIEAQYGSLGRGVMANRAQMTKTAGELPRPIFTSLTGGMQTLPDAVVASLFPEALHLSTQVQAVQPQDNGWLISAGYGSDLFDAAILATPAYVASELVQIASSALSAELAGIRYSSSVIVALLYDADVRAALPPGFGFLVPRSEGMKMLATTFVHNKFPHRAPENRALLRCFLGGTRGEGELDLSDEQILGIVRAELRQILGVTAEPLAAHIYRWKRAMAQYSVDHLERLDRIEVLVEKLPGLALAGNGYRGIGVPDCVRSGTQAAERALAAVGLRTPESLERGPEITPVIPK